MMGNEQIDALLAVPLAALLARFAPQLRIAHHIPGRVRLRLDAAALKEAGLAGSGDGGEGMGSLRLKGEWTGADAALPGVRRVAWNLLARSCTIEYEPARIPDAAWPDLLAGRDTPAAAVLHAALQQAQRRISHGVANAAAP